MNKLNLAAAVLACAIPSLALGQDAYRFGGGPQGGAWGPAMSAGVQLLNREGTLEGVSFSYAPSQGAVDNVRRVSNGDFDSTWGHIVQIYESWNGTGQFEEDGASRDFRVIANVRSQSQVIAVLDRSPIQSFEDMAGMRVNLSARGTGGYVNCRNIFEAAGLLESIEERNLGFSDAARALGDRQIDVFCSAGVPFSTPLINQLSVRQPVRYVSMSPELQARVVEENPFYAPVEIPVQEGVNGMTEAALSIAYDVWWLVHEDMTDEAVYEMLSIVADEENLASLTDTVGYWSTLSGDMSALERHGILVHPAAARYWGERGYDVPESIVQGFE